MLVTTLARYPTAYQKAMVASELGINTLEPETVKLPEALTMGASYLVGSIFPLAAYCFFPVPMALPISLVLTFVALVVVGLIKGKLARMNLLRSIVEMEAIFARLKPPDAEAAQWGTGRLHHIAFGARGLKEMRQRLTDSRFAFTERTLTGLGKHLVLVKDPDNVEIELAFTLEDLESAR